MSFVCRQCESTFPTSAMNDTEAVTHLVDKHPGRAVTYIRKLRQGLSYPDLELDSALSNRMEYPNKYGTYE